MTRLISEIYEYRINSLCLLINKQSELNSLFIPLFSFKTK